MKYLILILTLFISACTFSQDLKAYVTQKGKFDYRDSTYSYTNYSGTMFTFEKMIGKLGDKKFIRIGVEKSYGRAYHDFEIKRVDFDKDGDYILYYMESPFDSRIVLKYNNEDFLLFFVFDDKYDNGNGLWANFYKGIMFKRDEKKD